MEPKKILKIAGLVIACFIILLVGIIIITPSFNKTGKQSLDYQTFSGGVDLAQRNSGAPSNAIGEMFLAETALDSGLAPASKSVSSPSSSVDKKIIKTGSLNLKVEKAEAVAESISNIARLNKGEVASSNFSQSSRGIKSGYIIIRVPFQNFDAAFNEIKKTATQILNESTNAQDITAEYIDLEARLKNKRAEEQSFVALLNRSGKIEEVLSVTRETARVRGEIEQLEGQLRYLSSQTDMSTITINLSEDVEITPVSQDWRPWQVVKTSVKQLITGGQNFIDGLIRFLVVTLPMLLIYILVVWVIYLIGRKIYRRFKKTLQ